jgi:Tol biopolymer transport system component
MMRRLGLCLLVLGACSSSATTTTTPNAGGGVITYATPTDEVHAFDVATSTDTKLADGAEPDRMADGSIVFVATEGLVNEVISLAGADGSNPRVVVKPGSVTATQKPAGSPDGTKVAFTYYPRGFSHTFSPDDGIVVVGMDGAIVATLPGVFDPAWTPDGRIVAAGTVHTASGNENAEPTDTPKDAGLFVSDGALKKTTKIPVTLDHPMTPAVSPDGSLVAFVQNDHVFVVGIDGSGLRQLTTGDHIDAAPTFSPDGASIAFESLGTYGLATTYAALAVVPVNAAAPLAVSDDASETATLRDPKRTQESSIGRITAFDRMRWR